VRNEICMLACPPRHDFCTLRGQRLQTGYIPFGVGSPK
jgi:hypothetical protein